MASALSDGGACCSFEECPACGDHPGWRHGMKWGPGARVRYEESKSLLELDDEDAALLGVDLSCEDCQEIVSKFQHACKCGMLFCTDPVDHHCLPDTLECCGKTFRGAARQHDHLLSTVPPATEHTFKVMLDEGWMCSCGLRLGPKMEDVRIHIEGEKEWHRLMSQEHITKREHYLPHCKCITSDHVVRRSGARQCEKERSKCCPLDPRWPPLARVAAARLKTELANGARATATGK